MDTTSSLDRASATRALTAAVTDAAGAPSIHNTQPWRWRIDGGVADLYADARRALREADPDRHLLVLSCGAALHQACVALDAAGIAVEVARLLPMSAAVESPVTRRELQRLLAGLGYPYLALRLGIADADLPRTPRTPRLPAAANIEILHPADLDTPGVSPARTP